MNKGIKQTNKQTDTGKRMHRQTIRVKETSKEEMQRSFQDHWTYALFGFILTFKMLFTRSQHIRTVQTYKHTRVHTHTRTHTRMFMWVIEWKPILHMTLHSISLLTKFVKIYCRPIWFFSLKPRQNWKKFLKRLWVSVNEIEAQIFFFI